MTDGAALALNMGVLPRLAGLDMLDRNVSLLSPDQQHATGVVWAEARS